MFYITHGIVNVPLTAYIHPAVITEDLRDQSSLIMWENCDIDYKKVLQSRAV